MQSARHDAAAPKPVGKLVDGLMRAGHDAERRAVDGGNRER